MSGDKHFAVVTIPLNRPDVVDFLLPPSRKPKGAQITIVGQRPTYRAEAAWIEILHNSTVPHIADYLAIDDPGNNLTDTYTDRLVPIELLAKPDYLTRNLGGWAPIYFAVACLPANHPDDPLLQNLEVLTNYGHKIRYFGADDNQVAGRLEKEVNCGWPEFLSSLLYLHNKRPQNDCGEDCIIATMRYVERLFQEVLSGNRLATAENPPIPRLLLYEELLSQMRRLELARRRYLAEGKTWLSLIIQNWQEERRRESGLIMIVKGEYISGRHRGSLVLIAPQLGIVIKQPAPEPLHEIVLSARTFNEQEENWPALMNDGLLVTPRGRIRLLLEEEIIPRIHKVFNHPMTFSTLFGFTLEAFVIGQTIQDYVLADPARMTADLYDVFVLHQQTCELLDIENGDWHSANFILREKDKEIVHVDWGAARPLQPTEKTSEGFKSRLNQVQNIAYSFHNEAIAGRVRELHAQLLFDEDRLAKIKNRAVQLIG